MSGWTPPPLPSRWTRAAAPRFVGRRSELACLEALWTAASGGARQVVFLGGEPGAGKSRLLAEFSAHLHERGATVLLGTCAAELGPPYQPFVEPIEALLPATEPGPAREALARLVGRAAEDDSPEPDTRRELYDAAVDAVRALTRGGPAVLALEDVHWSGRAGLQLLGHLVERTAELPLLVLATHRTTAPERSAALTGTIASLYRLDGVRRMDLAGLDTEEVAEYLAHEAELPAHRARVAAVQLRDRTGGNPFLLRELLRDALGARPDPAGSAPLSVRDMLAARLARLTVPERQTLELAAVVGEEPDLATLLAVAAWSTDSTLAALDTAVEFGLLEPAGAAFRFPHSLARQAVLDLMPATRRAREHLRVAAVLEASGTPSDRRTQRLAHHYAQGAALGAADRAVRYLTEAAEAATRSLAHEDAARWFEQAAALSEDPAQRHRLLLAAARGHLLGGDFARARARCEEVAATAAPADRLAAAIGFEAASWRPGLPGQRAVELLTDALRGVPHDPADPLYVRGLAGLGRALAFTGAVEPSGELGRRSVEMARALGDDALLAATLEASLWNGLRPADAPAKLARATELTALAQRMGDLGPLGPAGYWRAAISYQRGDPEGVAEAHRDVLRMVRATGEPYFEYVAGCIDYARQFVVGDFAGAERTCARLLELGESFGTDDTEGSSAVQTFMLRRETGALEAVRPLMTGDEAPEEHWAPGLLALYTELGLDDAAHRLVRWLLDGRLERYEDSAQCPCVLAFLVEAALRLDDPEALRTLRPRVAEYTGTNLVAGQFVAVFGSADRYLGTIDSALRAGSAGPLLEAALEMDTRTGATVHRAQSLVALGTHLRRSGHPGRRADELLDEGRRLATDLGLGRLLRTFGPSPARRAASRPARPAGLTSREAEVLKLLGEGLLNREISARLVISENTVANHVRSILAKTGAGNRTQAAMYAAAHGLLEGSDGLQ
ncbi:helix-turn-helix transcriptional regulator [Geodermatophilus sp. SYSU D00079]